MNRIPVVSATVLCALLLAACGTEVAAPGTAAAGPEPAASDIAAPSAAQETDMRQAELGVSADPVPHLTDASGASLYYLEGNADGSRCDAACEAIWPPVLGRAMLREEDQRVAQGLDPGALGELDRGGGRIQTTYRGNPLYRYAGDLGATRTAGDGIRDEWGHWQLARP
ncbi:MAG TPA: hypothetical protein VFF91_08140 [Pseudoxanthomonas sp.]|nr:hypothetical protein [Pseudoxanthomonas sp.]